MKKIHTIVALITSVLILSGCTFFEKEPEDNEATQPPRVQVSGARGAVFSMFRLSQITPVKLVARPSSPLGMYVSMYLAQERMLRVLGALKGIDTQVKLARADESIERDETFTLLEEYGSILQIDIKDTLNRAKDREEALTKYLRSLEHMNNRMEEKESELTQKLEAIEEERRDQRKQVREVERDVKRALKEKDYAAAGPKQEDLTKLEGELAEIETKEKQLKNVLKIYSSLIKIGLEREEAIYKNRELLIAGLKVIDVPGIEELGVVIEE